MKPQRKNADLCIPAYIHGMLKCSHHNFPHDLGNYCIQNCTVGKTNWQSVKKNSDRIDQVFIVMFKAEHEHRIVLKY